MGLCKFYKHSLHRIGIRKKGDIIVIGMGHTDFGGSGKKEITSASRESAIYTPRDRNGDDHSLMIFCLSELPLEQSSRSKNTLARFSQTVISTLNLTDS